MLTFYSYIYAWSFIRSERQWGKDSGTWWNALMASSLLMLINMVTLFSVFVLWLAPVFLGHAIGIGKFEFLALSTCVPVWQWFSIVRSGRGEFVVREICQEAEAKKRQGERKLIGCVVASIAALAMVWLVGAFVVTAYKKKSSTVSEHPMAVITPHTVRGVEISHAVLSGGEAVLAFGQAEIAGVGGSCIGMEILPHSGHFLPSHKSLQIGIEAIAKLGILF